MSSAPGPRVLLVGGVDPSGGAGLTVDASVALLHGATPLPLAVTLTAQSRRGFRAAFAVPPAQWRAALEALLADAPVAAIKIGLLASRATVAAVAEALRGLAGAVPIVVDPVLGATAGAELPMGGARNGLLDAYRQHLLPLAAVVTPNEPEFTELFGGDARRALLLAPALLRKGGHGEGALAADVLYRRGAEDRFERPRLPVGRVRGTGCALATAIAAHLARGVPLERACRDAGDWLATRLSRLGPPPADGLPRLLPLLPP